MIYRAHHASLYSSCLCIKKSRLTLASWGIMLLQLEYYAITTEVVCYSNLGIIVYQLGYAISTVVSFINQSML